MWQLRKENWLLPLKKNKKSKNKIHRFLDHAGNDNLLNQLLLSLGCWLMLARTFCVYNAGLKVDTAREILTVIMASNDENVRSCKRHTVAIVCCTFCFWRSLCPFLALWLTTVSLDMHVQFKKIDISFVFNYNWTSDVMMWPRKWHHYQHWRG